MNIYNEKIIFNFLKKLNTLRTYKDISKEVTIELAKITRAKVCWICLINPGTSKIGIKRFQYSRGFENDSRLKKEVEKIHMISSDLLTTNFETEDSLDYFNAVSKDEKIIEPIIYRNNLLGYIGLIGKDKNFNKLNRFTVGIFIENINSRLEIVSLFEEIEKSEKERMEFLASISHEFKTPLNSIIGFSDIMKIKCEDTDNYKYVDNISKSSRFLLSLIQDVLDLARAKSKPLELKFESFRPKEVISDIIWSFEEERKEKNIEFSYTLSDVELMADLKRFKQMTFNLISNAIKFNKIDGKITIVTYLNENKEFIFEIKDTGDGISKKDYAKIFNFFSQVNRNKLKRRQGSGVGLAVCKTLAQGHGGDVYLKSRLNYGSTFWFRIPQKQ